MLLFREEVFSSRPHNTGAGMRACGANILAPGLAFSPAFTAGIKPGDWHLSSFWEVVSSYSSATASDFHGIPRIHTRRYKFFRKELGQPCGRPATRVKAMLGGLAAASWAAMSPLRWARRRGRARRARMGKSTRRAKLRLTARPRASETALAWGWEEALSGRSR